MLDGYKQRKKIVGVLSNAHFVEGFDDAAFAQSMSAALSKIPSGPKHASQYHSFMIGLLTFVFYPSLVCPVKEREIHKGRKRIDIVFTNTPQDPFHERILASAQTRAAMVLVECKNYSTDVANPELDQLSGRFGNVRGKFGMLLCRQLADPELALERCRDTAGDDRGFVLMLTDGDIQEFLSLIAAGKRSRISDALNIRLNKLF